MDATTAKMSGGSVLATMLVVEDEVFSRRALLKLLKSVGFDVTGVGSAEEAIQQLAGGNATQPNWIVVDVDLPGMCGLDLVRMIRMFKPDIHPMLVTGADRLIVQEFCDENAVDYFPKPLDIPRFLGYLRKESPDLRSH
jgi:CheY-like chemotaxis protein